MRKCREIVQILASGERLGLINRIELWLHLSMCGNCSRFVSHLRIMKNSFLNLFKKMTVVDKDTVKKLEQDMLDNIKN